MPKPLRVDDAGEPLRLMAVHAHPDDESSKGAATMARYAHEGVQVLVATCTGGERGDVLNPKMDRPEVWANLAEIRRAEMARAREILGVEQVWLGFVDSGLPEGDPLPPLPEGCFAVQDVDVAATRLVAHIRAFRPHVLLTYDEKGGYPHPDHVMCHKISMAALSLAADPNALPEAGPAWQVKKVYYHMGGHRNRFLRLDQLMHEHGLEPVYTERLASFPDDQRAYRLTTFVPCADYFSVRDEALRAHATQIDPDGHWFAVPMEIQKLGWPTEDYQLVLSTVPTVIPEDDLFCGIALPNPEISPDYGI
ncbi:MAG: mycothiol conjugate amidase Mca [Actinobacteria bacterium]|nr:mycothiol conjugate amidase Mca [Actinomycetota bacterium]